MAAIYEFLYELTGATGAFSLFAQLPTSLPISVGAAFPLAQHVDLPGSSQGGELLFDLRHLTVGPVRVEAVRPGPKENQISIDIAVTTLSGRYEIFGMERPAIDIDTGGAFTSLKSTAGILDTDNTEKQYRYLVRADHQRKRLLTTTRGQALVDQYNKYGDTYSDVYNSNSALRTLWEQYGTTGEMADHTYEALAPSQLDDLLQVNPDPSQKTFGAEKKGYNENAFQQQNYLASACISAGYLDAAAAALDFQQQVQTTGNTGSKSVPMTEEQVYGFVQSSSDDAMSRAGRAAVSKILLEALTQLVSGTETESSRQLLANHSMVYSEEVLAGMRAVYEEGRRKSEEAPRVSLWQSYFSTLLDKSQFVYDLTEQPNGVITAKLHYNSLRILTLNVDSSTWTGPAGVIATERVRDARFILSMLENRIASALTRHVRTLGARRRKPGSSLQAFSGGHHE